ncbi:hypothetical protein ACN42_g11931, partial [Penicillium freii]
VIPTIHHAWYSTHPPVFEGFQNFKNCLLQLSLNCFASDSQVIPSGLTRPQSIFPLISFQIVDLYSVRKSASVFRGYVTDQVTNVPYSNYLPEVRLLLFRKSFSEPICWYRSS